MSEPSSPDRELADTLALVRRGQRGDHAALERLFERYYPELHRMVRPMLGGGIRRFLESGDVLAEALYDAIRTFDSYEIDSREQFVALMRRIVENRIRQAARYHRAGKRDRDRERALEHLAESATQDELTIQLADGGPSPSTSLLRSEELDELRAALARLPERTRLVVQLREEGGRTWAEIAARAGFPSEDAARMHFARALLELRDELRARLDGPG